PPSTCTPRRAPSPTASRTPRSAIPSSPT
ncbi:uncharacterized protein METZ01_LOCUS229966, partial [marine metagenome]